MFGYFQITFSKRALTAVSPEREAEPGNVMGNKGCIQAPVSLQHQ